MLGLGALGVIYGDIGTSPLYAVRESFHGAFSVDAVAVNILGVLSLITWSLVIIVALKYQIIVLRADNEGEGGILALTALVRPRTGVGQPMPKARVSRTRAILISIGLFGAALLLGDGILTPAISVLAAMEGLTVLNPSLESLVVPATLVILVGLFLLQRRGTGPVGNLFGPITLVWFLTLAVLGVRGILIKPEVLAALNPGHAATFLVQSPLDGFLVLGAVFLVVTGSEALYADLGHFGPGPIRFSWFFVVFPCLLLNYFGQGALVLSDPSTRESPFFLLAPDWGLVPLILISAAATVIASQAIISGMFSLAMQAVQLGDWPRMEIRHTSAEEYGQVYVPPVNWALMIGTVALVLAFRSSAALTHAYGVAIICTMLVTTVLLYVVLPSRWGWPPWLAAILVSSFLAVELAFLAVNLLKIRQGGYVPLVIAAGVFLLMTTWRRGRKILARRLETERVALKDFLDEVRKEKPKRVPGTAVFMSGDPETLPLPLVMNYRHNRVLHERVVFLNIRTEDVPRVPPSKRLDVKKLDGGFWGVVARYGFMEAPNVPEVVRLAKDKDLEMDWKDTTVFLGRQRLIASRRPGGMAIWREHVFAFMVRNSQRASTYYHIPADRVVEIGTQVEL